MYGFDGTSATHAEEGEVAFEAGEAESRFEIRTRLKAEEVIERARDFFGPEGLDFWLTRDEGDLLLFEGDGGSVSVGILEIRDGKGLPVEVISKGWPYLAREFIRRMLN